MLKLVELQNSSFEHLAKRHPCLNGEANVKYGRVHIPVSPSCNIQCKFCKRGFNKHENRPGVTAGVITPAAALEYVDKALELCPEITVVGIAGPGDTLATDHALRAFRLVHKKYPQLIKCMSTNGLLLPDKAEAVINSGVNTITVTVNSINPETQQNICSYINYNGKLLLGKEAAEVLIDAQLRGIEKIASLGACVKINTVLIPGINDGELESISRETAGRGASIINIIPLIPQNEMLNRRAPDCNELNTAREAAEKHLPVFRHCQHCRADACGIPGSGKELSGLLYDRFTETFSHG